MIYEIWYMIYDIWYIIYDIWYMIYNIWYMIWHHLSNACIKCIDGRCHMMYLYCGMKLRSEFTSLKLTAIHGSPKTIRHVDDITVSEWWSARLSGFWNHHLQLLLENFPRSWIRFKNLNVASNTVMGCCLVKTSRSRSKMESISQHLWILAEGLNYLLIFSGKNTSFDTKWCQSRVKSPFFLVHSHFFLVYHLIN